MEKENLEILLEENLMPRIPKDNWGNNYVYVVLKINGDNEYTIYSVDPNGIDEKCKHDDICLER